MVTVLRSRQSPIPAYFETLFCHIPHIRRTWFNSLDSYPRWRRIAELQEGTYATRIDLLMNYLRRRQHFDFSSEKKAVGLSRMTIIKQLDVRTIARQQKFAASQIPDCDGERAPTSRRDYRCFLRSSEQ